MRLGKLGITISILIALLLSLPFSSRAEGKDGDIKYVRGRIEIIDFAGSKIILKRFHSARPVRENMMTFSIPSDVRVSTDKRNIFKNQKPAGIVDLVERDHVIIGYRDGGKRSNPEAVSISILEHDRPIAY